MHRHIRALLVILGFAAAVAPALPACAQAGNCFGDVNGDGVVGSRDLTIILSAWGPCPGNSCGADVNGDGVIDGVDIQSVLDRWGVCAPVVSTVSPASGPVGGGTTITISGSNLLSTSAVSIGGVPAASFAVVSMTSVTAVTPPGAVGPAAVAVTTAGGTATQPNAFTYAVPWYTVLEAAPDPAVVTNGALRNAITASGYPWRVRDNATQIEMLLVPAGTYTRGCAQGSDKFPCTFEELPTHTVTLTRAFYIGRFEVTQAQWLARVGSNPSEFRGLPDSPSRPVEKVSYNMIQGFLAGTGLRLPTEGEWEFACRAGTTTPFHSGPDFPNGTTSESLAVQVAWFANSGGFGTRPVGGLAANALGIHDMHGNVYEWCSDYWSNYTATPKTDPAGPPTGSDRVLRGGAYPYSGERIRSSFRTFVGPAEAYPFLGFRVARLP